jgi:hypothetical protein
VDPGTKIAETKGPFAAVFIAGNAHLGLSPDASTPSTNAIFARTKEMHPDSHPQVCFAVFNGNFDSLSPLHSIPQLHSQLGREDFEK